MKNKLFFNYILKKKISISLIIFFALIYIVLSNINSIYTSSIGYIYEGLKPDYGTYHYIWCDMTDAAISRCKKNDKITSLGFMDIYDTRYYGDKSIKIGSIDEISNEISGIHITEGRWPENSDEIVITENYRYLIGNLAVGKIIRLTDEKHEDTEYTVTGFVNDYKELLDEDIADLYCADAFIYLETVEEPRIRNGYIQYDFDLDHEILYTYSPITEYYDREFDGVVESEYKRANHIDWADQLYLTYTTLNNRWNFIALTVVSYLIVSYFLMSRYFTDYRDIAINLYKIGSDRIYIIKNAIYIALILSASGVALGVIISQILSLIVSAIGIPGIKLSQQYIWSMLILIGAAVVSIIYLYNSKVYDYRVIFSKVNKKHRVRIKPIKEYSVWNMMKYSIIKNFREIFTVSLLLGIAFIIFIGNFNYLEKVKSLNYTEEDYIGIKITAGKSDIYDPDDNLYIARREIKELYDIDAVERIEFSGEPVGYTAGVPVKKGSTYIEKIYFDNEFAHRMKITEYPEDEYFILSEGNISFVILTDENIADIQNSNPNIDFSVLKNDNVILFCGKTYSDVSSKPVDVGDSFTEGENLTVLTESINHSCFSKEFRIEKIITDYYYLRDRLQAVNGIVCVMSMEAADECLAYNASPEARIYYDKDISEEEYKKLYGEIYSWIRSKSRYAGVYTSDSSKNSFRMLSNSANLGNGSGLIMEIILFIYILLTLFYIELKEDRNMYGILRATGISRKEFFKMHSLKILVSSVITGIVSLITVIILTVLNKEYFSLFSSAEYTAFKLRQISVISCMTVLSIIIVAVIGILINRVILKKYYRESISSLLRFDE